MTQPAPLELVKRWLSQLLVRYVREFEQNARYGEDSNFVYLTLMKNLCWGIHSAEFNRVRDTVADLGGSLISYGMQGNVMARFTISKAKLGLK